MCTALPTYHRSWPSDPTAVQQDTHCMRDGLDGGSETSQQGRCDGLLMSAGRARTHNEGFKAQGSAPPLLQLPQGWMGMVCGVR